ncbi:hypothetical protein SAMN05216598_3686 [Pseudomonas asplenii]|uniref:Uncharacterized protein n=1 Tax=Pseudomonas asplenii TaxID=53407 RepID=A0A1H1X1Q3_9PSED|nr:hypothetical protein SAMN05216598_3686 [Pseudomonas asplenii]
MESRTIRWLGETLIGMGAGAAITGFSTLYLLAGEATPRMVSLGVTLFVVSIICFVCSYVCAIQEVWQ